MKIIAVLGSPQPRGNTAGLARAFLAAAREQGAEVQEYLKNIFQRRRKNVHPGSRET